jgi:toxin YoeB
MTFLFTENGWEDFQYWMASDPEIANKIITLLNEIRKTPFQGMGKPEPLRYDLTGYWSRRITNEHRLVYSITGKKGANQQCWVVQCRFHYS